MSHIITILCYTTISQRGSIEKNTTTNNKKEKQKEETGRDESLEKNNNRGLLEIYGTFYSVPQQQQP